MQIEKFIECDSQVETCFYELPPCLSQYKILKRLGEGSYGAVYDAGDYVIKCIPIGTNVCDFCIMSTRAHFKLESLLTSYLSDLGLGPSLIETKECATKATSESIRDPKMVSIGILIMEKWDITLADYKAQYPNLFEHNKEEIREAVLDQIELYIKYSVLHLDTKPQNTMLKLTNEKQMSKLTFIDFGVVSINSPFPKEQQRKMMLAGFKGFFK
jgi:serine/threonine protein kinase